MSAYVVDPAHIDYLVSAAIEWGKRDHLYYKFGETYQEWEKIDVANADAVGADLLRENIASVAYRYEDQPEYEGGRGLPGPVPTPAPDCYTFRPVKASTITPAQAALAIHGYEYQACEHPGWKGSAAYEFCRSLEKRILQRLPGYGDAAWELTDSDVEYASVFTFAW